MSHIFYHTPKQNIAKAIERMRIENISHDVVHSLVTIIAEGRRAMETITITKINDRFICERHVTYL
jgi:hypothetical protein